MQMSGKPQLETSEIQAIIVTGYGHLPWSSYLFLHIEDATQAQKWLAEIIPEITVAEWDRTSDGRPIKPTSATQIAFTCDGFAAIGLQETCLDTFSEEFRQGMGDKARARKLGDNGGSAPEHWEVGDPGGSPEMRIHLLLIIEAPDEQDLDRIRGERKARLSNLSGLKVIHEEQGHPLPNNGEHFGFGDSISEPRVEGSPKPLGRHTQTILKAGEFILGYKNEYGVLPATPVVPRAWDTHNNLQPAEHTGSSGQAAEVRDLGRNGSYMVFRKLHQDVALFRSYIAANAEEKDRLWLAAKFVGRWQSGLPLVWSPGQDDAERAAQQDLNSFTYMDQDPYGHACPVGSHIRRSNPRDTMENREVADSLSNVRRHAIIRRGAVYGAVLPAGDYQDDGKPRGLLFICINSDIKRQFEFIQQTWCNNHNFSGLYNDPDPLIGDNEEPGEPVDPPTNFTVQSEAMRVRYTHTPRFVTVKGGGYFFLPSIAALYFLARVKRPVEGAGPPRGGADIGHPA